MVPFKSRISAKLSLTFVMAVFLMSLPMLLIQPFAANADVVVEKGVTPIKSGDALSASDITMKNDKIAISIAAGTPAPWGVAKGGILDGAIVKDGKPGVDRITLVDFIPNNWSSWPTTYQKFSIVKNSPEEGVVQIKRDWGKCQLVTTYTLEKGSDTVKLVTTINNTGKKATGEILSGYVLWAKGGYHYGPPGLGDKKKTEASKAFSDWAVTYDANWMVALHAPYYNFINYHGRDMYLQNNLKPGEQKVYTGYLQITPSGDLAPVLKAEIERKHLSSGTIAGSVRTIAGKEVAKPYIVVKKQGQPYTWGSGKNGKFDLTLPVGQYDVYATAAGYAASSEKKIVVKKGEPLNVDFDTLKAPGSLKLEVKDNQDHACDARIAIVKGKSPLIRFLGKKTFFTELDKRGQAELTLAPGKYEFAIESGANFFSQPVALTADIAADKTLTKNVVIKKSMPEAKGWHNVDLHHHSDQLDGKTPPEFLVRSQLAADVDFAFVSDHDTVVNYKKIEALTKKAGIPFIPSIEISPSWGHFNAYPLPLDVKWNLDSGTATVAQIFAYARKKGARIIQENHPFIPYGYYHNVENKTITGAYQAGFDLVELNADAKYKKAWKLAMAYWNQGDRYYLTAGTDLHDVWARTSGEIRMFAYTPGSYNVDTLVTALKDGHSYASFGPMMVPENFMFGNQVKLTKGQTAPLAVTLKAVNGLAKASLIEGGKEIKTLEFKSHPVEKEVKLSVSPAKDTWAAIVVEDAKGKKAYSNPVWLDVTEPPAVQTGK